MSDKILDLNSYCTLLRFWPTKDLALFADGPTGCSEVGKGVCLFV